MKKYADHEAALSLDAVIKTFQGKISHTGEGQRKPWIRIKNEDND
tara:strand:- start:194 stop:328 length:135 start_codon:yes stop_codon:yes gene_type:complete